MPEDQRIPGSPGDMHLSGSSRGAHSHMSPAQHYTPSHQPPPPPPPPPHISQTRNIFIGAFATIIASTSVYYLTQYVNNRKAETEPTHVVVKNATYDAWKSYVTLDNVYYKGLRSLTKTLKFPEDREDFPQYLETLKSTCYNLSDEFVNETEAIVREKNVDKTFKSMLNRRIKREKESKELLNEYTNSIYSFYNSTKQSDSLQQELLNLINDYRTKSRILFELGVTELEDISKALSTSYGFNFDPNEVNMYSEYKKGVFGFENITEETDPDLEKPSKDVYERDLVGNWHDGENNINLLRDGRMDYSLVNGQKASGSWKIEDDLLKLDIRNNANVVTSTQYFRLYNIRRDTFVMKLTTPPYDKYTAIRIKE